MCLVSQSCPTLCSPIDSSLQGSSVTGFLRQEYWSRLPFPSPWDLLTQGSKPHLLCLLCCRQIFSRLSHWGSHWEKMTWYSLRKKLEMFNLCFRTLVLTIVLFCFMDNGVFFIFSSQDVVAAEKKKQMVAEQVMIDHLSRQALIEIHSENIHYISFLFYFFKFYFIFKLYNIVLVLPNIKMNPPQVSLLPPLHFLFIHDICIGMVNSEVSILSLFTALFFPTRLLAQQKYFTVLFTKYFLSK